MKWQKRFLNVPQYEFASVNQHGARFRRTRHEQIQVAHLSCGTGDAGGVQTLILLSHTLDVPIRCDFDSNEAYIEVVSNEALMECTKNS